jgi:hypothetical protein
LQLELLCLGDPWMDDPDTLIVWTEPDGKDYALSFQDVEGCTEVWEFITEVRRHLRSANGKCDIVLFLITLSNITDLVSFLRTRL